MKTTETVETLLKRIRDRRGTIKRFIERLEPRGARLTSFNILCGSIATVLTATPAIGGKSLAEAFGAPTPGSPAWRIVFASAALFSLLSTVAANLYKSNDIASRLAKAQGCDAKLEGLETLLELNQIGVKESATQYTQCVSEIPFISDSRFLEFPTLDWVRGDIDEPKPDQVVGSTIHCSGWVEGMGSKCHLWLAVETLGFVWPKEREIPVDADGTWKETIYEQGAAKPFSISLFAADDRAHKRIRAWLDRGDETGDYKQMRRLPGTRRIAKIDNLRTTPS